MRVDWCATSIAGDDDRPWKENASTTEGELCAKMVMVLEAIQAWRSNIDDRGRWEVMVFPTLVQYRVD